MRKVTTILSLFSLCIHIGVASRVRTREQLDARVHHPACGQTELDNASCPCAPLYDELVKQCTKVVRQNAESEKCRDARFDRYGKVWMDAGTGRWHWPCVKMAVMLRANNKSSTEADWILERVPKEILIANVNCKVLVQDLWLNRDPRVIGDSFVNYEFASSDIFLRGLDPLGFDKELPFGEVTLIAFWTGFAQSLGTRQTMDDALKKIHVGTDTYHVEDIEHESHLIGKVMRGFLWDRRCHKSSHDGDFWAALSRSYAAGAGKIARDHEGSIRYVRQLSKRRSSIMDDVDSRPRRDQSQVFVIYNARLEDLEKKFLWKYELELLRDFRMITLLDFKTRCDQQLIDKIAKKTIRVSPEKKIKCLCPEQNPEDSENSTDEVIVRVMQEAVQDINKLEAKYASGIVWKTIKRNSPEQAITKEDSLAKCQQRCNSLRDCAHFNYYSDSRECEILLRTDELEYAQDSSSITSGRRGS